MEGEYVLSLRTHKGGMLHVTVTIPASRQAMITVQQVNSPVTADEGTGARFQSFTFALEDGIGSSSQ
jgi:hypothetical protein